MSQGRWAALTVVVLLVVSAIAIMSLVPWLQSRQMTNRVHELARTIGQRDLVDHKTGPESNRVRADAAMLSIREVGPAAVTLLLHLLDSSDYFLPDGAAEALRQFPKSAEISIPALIEHMSKEDRPVGASLATIRTLVLLLREAEPYCPPRLIKMTTDEDPMLRMYAARVVLKIDPLNSTARAAITGMLNEASGESGKALPFRDYNVSFALGTLGEMARYEREFARAALIRFVDNPYSKTDKLDTVSNWDRAIDMLTVMDLK